MAKKAASKTNGTASNGVLPKLKEVYEFMTQNNLEAVELDEPGVHLKLVRRKAQAPMPVPVPVMTMGASPSHQPMPSAGVQAPAAPAAPAVPAGQTIKSTMMGIFYRAPSPSSPPFVKEGEVYKAGHVLCMIEAMKVFNEIKAEYNVKVVRVLLENGKPVKLGQDLFVVERA
jgi:acetyl-CoA carboxylase biotin carboxyl carrier protein